MCGPGVGDLAEDPQFAGVVRRRTAVLPPRRRATPPAAPALIADALAAWDLRALMEQATDLIYFKRVRLARHRAGMGLKS